MRKLVSKRTAMPLLAMGLLTALMASTANSQNVEVTPDTTYQLIRGFGGHNGAGWIADLTPAQVETAFGSGAGLCP